MAMTTDEEMRKLLEIIRDRDGFLPMLNVMLHKAEDEEKRSHLEVKRCKELLARVERRKEESTAKARRRLAAASTRLSGAESFKKDVQEQIKKVESLSSDAASSLKSGIATVYNASLAEDAKTEAGVE